MRHYKKGRKLGTDASHGAAIKRNLCVNLLANDRIKTTLERAKEIRSDVDRLITWAKRGDIHSRRLAIAKLGDKALVGELFAKVEQGLFKDRPGGYSRIYKVGKRRGDDAVIVIMELVQEPVSRKSKTDDAAPPAKSTSSRRKAATKAKTTKADTADKHTAPTASDADAREGEKAGKAAADSALEGAAADAREGEKAAGVADTEGADSPGNDQGSQAAQDRESNKSVKSNETIQAAESPSDIAPSQADEDRAGDVVASQDASS